MVDGDLKGAKKRLRTEIGLRIEGLDAATRSRKSREISRRVIALAVWAGSDIVLAYYPFGSEADIRAVLECALDQGKCLALPRVAGDRLVFHLIEDLHTGFAMHPWGIREPRPDRPVLELEKGGRSGVIVTPGVAFDSACGRLGRGGGYYDRLLGPGGMAGWRSVGVGYDEQIVDRVPSGPWDVALDAVVTDGAVFSVRAP